MEEGGALVPIGVPAWSIISVSLLLDHLNLEVLEEFELSCWISGTRSRICQVLMVISCELLHSALQGLSFPDCSAEEAAWVFRLGSWTQAKAHSLSAT